MQAERLTKRKIDGFKYAGGWDVRWDSDVSGLGVRLYPSGKKAFVLSFRAGGRKRLMVLGRFGMDLTIEQARERAQKHLVQVRDGKDPLDERRKADQGETFVDLEREYIEHHARPHKKTWETDRDRLIRHVPEAWRPRKARSITRQEVATVHRRIGATRPYEANRFLDLLRVMFGFARNEGFVDAATDNPAEGIRKFAEHKRNRFVTPDELPLIAKAIDREPNIYVRGAIWLYMLTGARKSELLPRRRTEVNWELARLRLPDSKSGDEQFLPLNAPALAILQSLPAQDKNPFLFCGAKARKHLVNIDKPWRRIRDRATMAYWAAHDGEAAVLVKRLTIELGREPSCRECRNAADFDLPSGLEDLHLHDLRRTVGSWMTQAHVDLNTIRDGLRHANIATTLTYARLGADPAREAFEAHGQRVMEAAGKSKLVEVAGGKT
jgi:site-specific recombinase XerD